MTLVLFLTGCVATQEGMTKGHTKILEGQENIVIGLQKTTDADLTSIRRTAEEAANKSRELALEAETKAEAIRDLRGIALGIAESLDMTGFLSTSLDALHSHMDRKVEEAKGTMTTLLNASEDAVRSKLGETEGRIQLENERLSNELKHDAREVELRLDLLETGLDERIAREFAELGEPLQRKLEAMATTETIERLQKAQEEGADELAAEVQKSLGLTKSELDELREAGMTPEEILQLLVALLTTGGLSTVAARKLSNSGARIDSLERQINQPAPGAAPRQPQA